MAVLARKVRIKPRGGILVFFEARSTTRVHTSIYRASSQLFLKPNARPRGTSRRRQRSTDCGQVHGHAFCLAIARPLPLYQRPRPGLVDNRRMAASPSSGRR
jgi:hypothetical protein